MRPAPGERMFGMCGIIAYVGPRDSTAILLAGLKRLEYRGYDSAGVAILDRGGQLGTGGGGSTETRFGRFEERQPAPSPVTPVEGEIVVENADLNSDDEEESP